MKNFLTPFLIILIFTSSTVIADEIVTLTEQEIASLRTDHAQAIRALSNLIAKKSIDNVSEADTMIAAINAYPPLANTLMIHSLEGIDDTCEVQLQQQQQQLQQQQQQLQQQEQQLQQQEQQQEQQQREWNQNEQQQRERELLQQEQDLNTMNLPGISPSPSNNDGVGVQSASPSQ